MKITTNNSYLIKHENGYCVCILMPDNSRNYLHSDAFQILDFAIKTRENLLLREINQETCRIIEDENYYRINIQFDIHDTTGKNLPTQYVFFHSRKLNLNDAVFEYDLIVN